MFLHFLTSIFVHFFLLKVVIDTYFRSPIELDLPLTNSTENPKAKRVVLIVADGLRARALFDKNESCTPFLTAAKKNGSWGISFGKPPTETRVGHTAIVAGIREDPRAILNGWIYYPVRYDSVLERSNRSWVIAASQKMTKIFGRYSTKNVKIFTPQQIIRLGQVGIDDWSLKTFNETLQNPKYKEEFSGSKNIFVVLLPDLDYYGHFYFDNYSTAVSKVDDKVRQIHNLTNQTFKDNATTFIFTADHGMYRRSHGTGLQDEISTPFIAWGAGIKAETTRKDVENIDIAPLISCLLGTHFPTNSLGKLPANYLDIDEDEKTHLMYKNLVQMTTIYKAKTKRLSRYMLMKRNISDVVDIMSKLDGHYLKFQNFETMHKKILAAISRIQFYATQDVLTLSSVYLFFWILYLFLSLIPSEDKRDESNVSLCFLSVYHCFLICLHRYVDIFFICLLLPFGTLCLFLSKLRNVNLLFKVIEIPPVHEIFVFVLFIFSIVLSFHFRPLLFLTSLLMASIVCFEGDEIKEEGLKNIWIVLCVILSGFPLISPDIEWNMDGTNYYVIGSLIWHFLVGCILTKFWDFRESIHLTKTQIVINSIQLFCSLTMSFTGFFDLKGHEHLVFWTVFIPVILVPFSMKSVDLRMATIFMAIAAVYMVNAKSFALIFLTFFTMILITWKIVETEKSDGGNLVNFRNTWILIGVNLLGFLGIVNFWLIKIPFTEESVQMDFIYLVRLFTPIIFSSCIFRYIVGKIGIDVKFCFIFMELLFCSMIFHFICIINNDGAWADIGTSFVRFNIVNFFPAVSLLFYFVSYFLLNVGSSDILEKFNLLLNCH